MTTIKNKKNKENIWKQHPEYPNYSANTQGQIKNNKTGKILMPYLNSVDGKGYLQVKLVDRSGLQHPVYVHRFIFECFYRTIPLDHEIHHINHDRCDNKLNNLQCLNKIDHAKLHQAERAKYQNK